MSFEKYSNNILKALAKSEKECRGYETEDSVDYLKSVIGSLIDLFNDIEYNATSCIDLYYEQGSENHKLQDKLDIIFNEANYRRNVNVHDTVIFSVEDYSNLELNVPNNQSFEEVFGLRLIDTLINDNLQKQYIFVVADEKKWMVAKIKYGI
jgi:hypothetical protein